MLSAAKKTPLKRERSNNMTYEEAYDLYRKMWEKKLAKGNRPGPSAPPTSDNISKADSAA